MTRPALMIELLAWIAATKTEFTRAASLLGTAHSIWRSIGTGISAFGPQLAGPHDRCQARTNAERLVVSRRTVDGDTGHLGRARASGTGEPLRVARGCAIPGGVGILEWCSN
ncbi:hypothetical protein [Nonomuraea sp. NPDC049480]|uniref:hypothetical protein n=1 Tax=Nonomuraea sp. NPDC049480 TaxID=3364353 RepID=UPI0037955DA3